MDRDEISADQFRLPALRSLSRDLITAIVKIGSTRLQRRVMFRIQLGAFGLAEGDLKVIIHDVSFITGGSAGNRPTPHR
jgi:hypothetical protein